MTQTKQEFELLWRRLQRALHPGDTIRNWSQHGEYLGGAFTIHNVGAEFIEVDPYDAVHNQYIRKEEFAKVYDFWDAYNWGQVPRSVLRDLTHFSTYVISILHHLETE